MVYTFNTFLLNITAHIDEQCDSSIFAQTMLDIVLGDPSGVINQKMKMIADRMYIPPDESMSIADRIEALRKDDRRMLMSVLQEALVITYASKVTPGVVGALNYLQREINDGGEWWAKTVRQLHRRPRVICLTEDELHVRMDVQGDIALSRSDRGALQATIGDRGSVRVDSVTLALVRALVEGNNDGASGFATMLWEIFTATPPDSETRKLVADARQRAASSAVSAALGEFGLSAPWAVDAVVEQAMHLTRADADSIDRHLMEIVGIFDAARARSAAAKLILLSVSGLKEKELGDALLFNDLAPRNKKLARAFRRQQFDRADTLADVLEEKMEAPGAKDKPLEAVARAFADEKSVEISLSLAAVSFRKLFGGKESVHAGVGDLWKALAKGADTAAVRKKYASLIEGMTFFEDPGIAMGLFLVALYAVKDPEAADASASAAEHVKPATPRSDAVPRDADDATPLRVGVLQPTVFDTRFDRDLSKFARSVLDEFDVQDAVVRAGSAEESRKNNVDLLRSLMRPRVMDSLMAATNTF